MTKFLMSKLTILTIMCIGQLSNFIGTASRPNAHPTLVILTGLGFAFMTIWLTLEACNKKYQKTQNQ